MSYFFFSWFVPLWVRGSHKGEKESSVPCSCWFNHHLCLGTPSLFCSHTSGDSASFCAFPPCCQWHHNFQRLAPVAWLLWLTPWLSLPTQVLLKILLKQKQYLLGTCQVLPDRAKISLFIVWGWHFTVYNPTALGKVERECLWGPGRDRVLES